MRRLWSEAVRVWFPKGLDDLDLALLRVTVEKAEYWDSPSATMTYFYGYAKSRLTGKPPDGGGNAKLKLACPGGLAGSVHPPSRNPTGRARDEGPTTRASSGGRPPP